MSLKRKTDEKLDDYCRSEDNNSKRFKKSPTGGTVPDSEDRVSKIKRIIYQEFDKELKQKGQEIDDIDSKLSEIKLLMHRLRYGVVSHYYTKRTLEYSQNELKIMDQESSAGPSKSTDLETHLPYQPTIHPSLKKLIGKKPIDYDEILRIRQPREAAKVAQKSLEKVLVKPNKRNAKEQIEPEPDQPIKIPRYVEPNMPTQPIVKVNSARGRDQIRHLIVVGNTSKYIGDEKNVNGGITHKWLLYVSTKTETPIERIVDKVRYYLHSSYKPNDVVESDSPPFRISRRGWGEFPVRIQLYFKDDYNQKPLQIIHNLVLDNKLTGLQTMGAETIVEIWLNKSINEDCDTIKSEVIENKSIVPENIKIELSASIHDHNYDFSSKQNATSMDNLLNIKHEPEWNEENENELKSEVDSNGGTDDSNVKSEPLKPPDVEPSVKIEPKKSVNMLMIKNKRIRCVDTNGKLVLMELSVDPNNPKNIKLIRVPDQSEIQPLNEFKNNITSQLGNSSTQNHIPIKNETVTSTTNIIPNTILTKSPVPVNTIGPPKPINSVKNVFLKNGQIHVLKSPASKPKQESLLKPQINLFKKSTITSNHLNNKSAVPIVNNPSIKSKTYRKSGLTGNQIFAKKAIIIVDDTPNYEKRITDDFFKQNFPNIRSAVLFLFRKIPLISSMANLINFNRTFPFVVDKIESYNKMTAAKQRNYEWLRAKHINRILKKHPDLCTNKTQWSTKDIILCGRQYGYAPPPLYTTKLKSDIEDRTNKNELKELIKNEIQREEMESLSLSYCQSINSWIHKQYTEKNSFHKTIQENDNLIVDITNEDDKKSLNPTKPLDISAILTDPYKTIMPFDADLEVERQWINSACKNIQVNLFPEEIVDGVYHLSAHRILVQAVRSFIEDLLTKSYSTKKLDVRNSTSIDTALLENDIRRAIFHFQKFDFLSNKYLGVTPIKKELTDK